MFTLYNKKLDVNMNADSLKIFQKYMDVKYNLNFDHFVPSLEFDEKSFVSKVVKGYSQIILTEAKYKTPTDLLHGSAPETKNINEINIQNSSNKKHQLGSKQLKHNNNNEDVYNTNDPEGRESDVSQNGDEMDMNGIEKEKQQVVFNRLGKQFGQFGGNFKKIQPENSSRYSKSVSIVPSTNRRESSITLYGKEKEQASKELLSPTTSPKGLRQVEIKRNSSKIIQEQQTKTDESHVKQELVLKKPKRAEVGTMVKAVVRGGSKVLKEGFITVESYEKLFSLEELNESKLTLDNNTKELSRINDSLGVRFLIAKALFPKFEMLKKYYLNVTLI